jgi:hypothetical protein
MPRLRTWLARGWVVVGLLAVNFVLIVLFRRFSAAYAPPDAVALQLSFSPEVFRSIVVDQWGDLRARAFLKTLTSLDFVFPLAYAGFLCGLYVWLSGKLKVATWWALEWAPFVAAGFDYLENLLQILLVRRCLAGANADSIGFLVMVTSLFAAAKWTLLVVSFLGTLAVLLRSEIGWALWTCRFGILSVLLGSIPLIATSQGKDLLRVIGDDALSTPKTFLTYVALVAWAASVWYWSRVLLQIRWKEGEPGGDAEKAAPVAVHQITPWLPRVLGTATLLLAALAFVKAAAGAPPELRTRLLVHAGYCLALGIGFFSLVKNRRRLLGWPPEPLRVESWRSLPRGTRTVAALAMGASLLMLLLFVAAPVRWGSLLGTPAIVFLAAANAVFFGSLCVLASRSLGVPFVVFALLAAAVFSRWNDNHAVRLLPLDPGHVRPGLADAFATWARPRLEEWQKDHGDAKMPVFLVAAEGGGVRAAYWTAVMLGRLQDRHPTFARQTFGISGVSGGSVGAAVFVALLHDGVSTLPCLDYATKQGHTKNMPGRGPAEVCAQEIVRQDLLAPAVGRLLATDFLQWFVPAPVPAFDRAKALEDTWSAAYQAVTGRPTLDQAYLQVSRGADGTELAFPGLLLNSTHVHTGQRLLRAPFVWPSTFPSDPADAQMPEITDLTRLLEADVRLSTAAHDSARFAYVSPAGRLLSSDGREFGHLVDGGYFENSGAATLRDVLHLLEATPAVASVAFHVVYLCNNPGRCYGATVSPDPARAEQQDPQLGEAFAPVRSLLGARDARGSLAIAHLKQNLGRRFMEFGVCASDPEPPVPLGWQLSEIMRNELSVQATGAGKAIGVKAAEDCVTSILAAPAGARACETAFKPGDGCGSKTPAPQGAS